MPDGFYRWFSQGRLTRFGRARKDRTNRRRLGLLMERARPPGTMLEIGPGHGSFGVLATSAGWRYRAVEASPSLAAALRARGFAVVRAWAPPFAIGNASCDVVYADQVLEHMPGVGEAREFVAEARRVLRPGGLFFVVVPDYVKERTFFWDVDYTHNFVTTRRRVGQLLLDGGFETEAAVDSIGNATGFGRDLLAAASILPNLPGMDTLAGWTGTSDLLFRIRKNLFATIEFVARKPCAGQRPAAAATVSQDGAAEG